MCVLALQRCIWLDNHCAIIIECRSTPLLLLNSPARLVSQIRYDNNQSILYLWKNPFTVFIYHSLSKQFLVGANKNSIPRMYLNIFINKRMIFFRFDNSHEWPRKIIILTEKSYKQAILAMHRWWKSRFFYYLSCWF